MIGWPLAPGTWISASGGAVHPTVDGGELAGAGAHSYSAGDATKGSEEASRFKK
mgnify:CR=1 FL=1